MSIEVVFGVTVKDWSTLFLIELNHEHQFEKKNIIILYELYISFLCATPDTQLYVEILAFELRAA